MRHELRALLLLIFVSSGITVIMESTEETILNNEDSGSFNEAFASCLARKEFGTLECANRGALSALQSFNQIDDLDFGEVHLERADGYGRELLDWDYDPKDFGNIVKAATRLMERRSMKWNLDNFYPGLQLRAGPMLNGNGMLEFVMNERSGAFGDRQAGPGRKKKDKGYGALMMGALAVGAMMAQLAYGKIAFLAGTALLTAKIALVLSAIIGLKKLVSSQGGGGHEVIYATGADHHSGYSGGYGGGGGGGGWQRTMENVGVPPT
ncbi:hypothetical protein WH47_04928 [Habropoda laboriosa]|uniref:Osiris 10 n=1 Tax=Habropoda laboriosa TaxID=597456 RepID=A0A0L7RJ09_9HYME|nr:hypothetical protein WH47_04928 [Habropoda laboriosa]